MSLENLLKYIEAITLLLPLVEKVVEMIEKIFGKFSGEGDKSILKKAAAVDLIQASAGSMVVPKAALSWIVDSVVLAKNVAGEFKHAG